MSSLWFYDDPIDRLHQENLRFLNSCRFCVPTANEQLALARDAEALAMEHIREMGFIVSPTRRNERYDLCVEGARVEVKASAWYPNQRGGRYQACIHHHEADLVVFDCVNGDHHLFIIPMANITPRRNIAVWKYDPREYIGAWAIYLDAWEHLSDAVNAVHRSWQPPLFNLSEF